MQTDRRRLRSIGWRAPASAALQSSWWSTAQKTMLAPKVMEDFHGIAEVGPKLPPTLVDQEDTIGIQVNPSQLPGHLGPDLRVVQTVVDAQLHHGYPLAFHPRLAFCPAAAASGGTSHRNASPAQGTSRRERAPPLEPTTAWKASGGGTGTGIATGVACT